jgi:hypothetical protein
MKMKQRSLLSQMATLAVTALHSIGSAELVPPPIDSGEPAPAPFASPRSAPHCSMSKSMRRMRISRGFRRR